MPAGKARWLYNQEGYDWIKAYTYTVTGVLIFGIIGLMVSIIINK